MNNENFLKENALLQRETISLSSRISILDKEMISFKIKYEVILKNVTKFNKGKENLNDLLSYQKISNNHFGIGFSKDKFEKSIHVGLDFSNHKSTCVFEKNHNPYNSFVKRNADTISKRIKNKYIWIPKN